MDLLTDRGTTVRLLRPLTRPGGEGQVFEIAGSDSVAKVYHQPADSQKVNRLRYQIQAANPSLRKIAAWPTELLVDLHNRGIVRGVLMPRISGKEIHKLYGPSDRQAEFPLAGWDFLIHVATNCAIAFDNLHESGIVMADVNEGNLLVKENEGTIGLIDCDSYQIKNGSGYFLCDVGVPMWTPPELQGRDFRGLLRTPNHDRFGLAVLIFRLLFMGRHPFAGIPTGREQIEIEEAIKKCLFAFSKQTWTKGVKQPPFSLSLAALPQKLALLFERAFLDGTINARPTGREWAQELSALKAALKKGCLDPGHKYWHGLNNCPWCEITNAGGPNFFISISVHGGNANIHSDFSKYWTEVENIFKSPLMSEIVTVPPIGRIDPKPMPLSIPQAPQITLPVAPLLPKPYLAPSVALPVVPNKPVLIDKPYVCKKPLGPNERSFRRAALIAVLCTVWFDCWVAQEAVVLTSAGLVGIIVSLLWIITKWRKARNEHVQRRDADEAALIEEKRKADLEYQTQLKLHRAKIATLIQKHAADIAIAESNCYHIWREKWNEYEIAAARFLKDKSKYDAEHESYKEKQKQWSSECERRKEKERLLRTELDQVASHAKQMLYEFQRTVRDQHKALEGVREQFEKAKSDELVDIRQLHKKREEVQLRQFLKTQLIADATIPKVGDVKKRTLLAYGYGSAFDVHWDMRVPGFGQVLVGNLVQWRNSCEKQFKYNPNVPLPPGEVGAVKIKYGKIKQHALVEMRTGASRLGVLDVEMRKKMSREKLSILELARAYAQAAADFKLCT